MQSRSGLERLLALAMAGGVVFASSLGSLHDPRCPHHPGASDHVSWYGSTLHGEASEARSADTHIHDHAPTQEPPRDCTCGGGLCLPSVVSGPPVRTAAEVFFGEVEADEPLLVAAEAAPTDLTERYRQPPGTGPPAVV